MAKSRKYVLGLVRDLVEALENPALEEFDRKEAVGHAAKVAVADLATAMGYCRLFGVQIPEELDGTLPQAEAIAASEWLAEFASHCAATARDFRPEKALVPLQEIACNFLDARMDAHAAMQSIAEAHEACCATVGEDHAAFDAAMDALLPALTAWDSALQESQSLALLSMAANTNLLANWRALLAEPWRSAPPWWLDGTLEERGAKV